MINQIMYYVFFAGLAIAGASVTLDYIKCLSSDLKKAKSKKRIKKYSRVLRKRPYFDVVVYSHNHEKTLEQSLNFISKLSYRNRRIIIVDNFSNDNSLEIIKKFQKTNKRIPARIMATNAQFARQDAIIQAINEYSTSELVYIQDGNVYTPKDTLHKANKIFLSTNNNVIIPNLKIHHDYKLTGLVQQTSQILDLLPKKALRYGKVLNQYNQAAFYRKNFIVSSSKSNVRSLDNLNDLKSAIKKHEENSICFEEKICVKSSAITLRQQLSRSYVSSQANNRPKLSSGNLRVLLISILTLIVLFLGYVGIKYGQYGYLFLIYAAFVVTLITNLNADSSYSTSEKLKQTMLHLPIFGLFILSQLFLTLNILRNR